MSTPNPTPTPNGPADANTGACVITFTSSGGAANASASAPTSTSSVGAASATSAATVAPLDNKAGVEAAKTLAQQKAERDNPFRLTDSDKTKIASIEAVVIKLKTDLSAMEGPFKELEKQYETMKKKIEEQREQIASQNEILSKILVPNDPGLARLLMNKLPNIHKIECSLDRTTGIETINFVKVEGVSSQRIAGFLKAFVEPLDITYGTGGYKEFLEFPFNQSIMRVRIAAADREKLIEGLKLAAAAPAIVSHPTYRC